MEKKLITLPKIKFIGLRIRTSYRNELDPTTSRITQIVNRFRTENIAESIPNRKNPNVLIIVYTNYASDEYDEYDYLIGEEVTTLDNVPSEMTGLIIPESDYMMFTSDQGPIPGIILETWQKIWDETLNKTLGAERKYQVDLEIYDERAGDPNNAVFDIYLGVK